MMTFSNGNVFRVTGPLWGESTAYRWISLTKASDGYFDFLSAREQAVDQTIETPVIWDVTVMQIHMLYSYAYHSGMRACTNDTN